MIALSVLIIIVVLLLLLLLLPVGADVSYREGDLRLYLRIGGATLCLYPRKGKKRKKATPQKQAEQPAKSKAEKQPKKRALPDVSKDEVLDAVSVAVKSVKKLRFHLHRLKLHFISAFDDPYQTAMVFGYANAAVSAFGLDRLKQADVQVGVDFEREKYYIDGYLSVTIRIYYICKLVCCLIGGAVPILLRRHKRLKQKQRSTAAQGKEA